MKDQIFKNLLSDYWGKLIEQLNYKSFIGVGVASPVRVWIENGSGNQLGYIDESYTYINEIPGSEYKRISKENSDSLTIMYLPKNMNYIVHLVAEDTGILNVSSIIPLNESTATNIEFSEVKILNENWVGELFISDSSNSENTYLIADNDGDGIIDDSISSDDNQLLNIKEPISNDCIDIKIYPNPFKTNIFIKSEISGQSFIEINIYDSYGRLIYTDKLKKNPVDNKIIWNGRDNNDIDVPAGVYFYQIKYDNYIVVKKIIKF